MTQAQSPGADPRDAFFDVSGLAEGAGRRAGRASILVLAMAAAKLALQLASTVLLSRLVPPAEFGIASLALPVAILVSNMSQFGLSQPIVQMKTVTHGLVSTLFWVNLALGLAFGGLMAGLSGVAARFYHTPEVAPVFAALGISVLFSSVLTQYIAMLRRRLQVRVLEYGALAAFALSTAIALGAALLGASYWAVVLLQILQPVLSVAIYAAAIRWVPSPPWKADLRAARGALGFGGNVAAANLLQQVSAALPVMLIGRHYSPFETGLYQRSNTLAQLIPARAVSPLASVFVSTLARLQEDGPAFRAMFCRMLRNINLIVMPAGVMGIVTSDLMVPFVLGEDWAPAAPVLAWICVGLLQTSVDQALNWSVSATGASRQIRNFGLIHLAVTGAVLLAAGFERPVEVLAAAIALGHLLLRIPAVIAIALRHTHLDFAAIARGYLIDLAASGAAIAAAFALRAAIADSSGWLQFCASGAAVAAVFGLRILADPEARRDIGRAAAALARRAGG